MSKIVFVSVQSYGIFTKDYIGNWSFSHRFLEDIARLHRERPKDVFVVPSIQNYTILPFLEESGPTYDSWKDRCRKLITVSDEVHVLTYKGWDDSVGVSDEIAYANELGIPVTYGSQLNYQS